MTDFQNYILPVLQDKGIKSKKIADLGIVSMNELKSWMDFSQNAFPTTEQLNQIVTTFGIDEKELSVAFTAAEKRANGEDASNLLVKTPKPKKKAEPKPAEVQVSEKSLTQEPLKQKPVNEAPVIVEKSEPPAQPKPVVPKSSKKKKPGIISPETTVLMKSAGLLASAEKKKTQMLSDIAALFDAVAALQSDIEKAENTVPESNRDLEELAELAKNASPEGIEIAKQILRKFKK